MRVVFAIARAATLDVTHTTIHIAMAALERGHGVRFVEPCDFEVDLNRRLIARAHALDDPPANRRELVELLNKRRAPRRYVEFCADDTLLLRVNPLAPEILAFAQLARLLGVRVHNDPSTLTLTNHKSYLASLPGVPIPPTMVTRSRAAVTNFMGQQRGKIVLKPARASGGRGVELVHDPADHQKIERAFKRAQTWGDGYVVAQVYLPEAEQGEKRLLWLDGKLIGGYLRMRSEGDFRHNLVRGSKPKACTIGEADHSLARSISPYLIRDGVWLAGLDVIGNKLVEVNTLNPGGVHYGDALNGFSMAQQIVARMEAEARRF